MRRTMVGLLTAAALGVTAIAVSGTSGSNPEAARNAAAKGDPARGKYLVTIMGCNDCHTPWIMAEHGPAPDYTRMLAGHPQDFVIDAPAKLGKGPWVVGIAGTNTAFSGPWGVSFTANLTPDPETGLGKWTPETFITAIRTGKHEGQGRPILPPMPWEMIRNATDEDLRSIFAYLQSIPPLKNRVPLPLDPPVN